MWQAMLEIRREEAMTHGRDPLKVSLSLADERDSELLHLAEQRLNIKSSEKIKKNSSKAASNVESPRVGCCAVFLTCLLFIIVILGVLGFCFRHRLANFASFK